MEKVLSLGPEPQVVHLGWEGGKARPGRMKHRGVLTLAIREEAPQLMVVGFTFCSPTDMFDKKEGRNKALKNMHEKPLRFRYIGNPFTTLDEVIRALCCREFDELGHFCGVHLDDVLFSIKTVPKLLKGGEVMDYVLEKVCRVPAWAKAWWLQCRHTKKGEGFKLEKTVTGRISGGLPGLGEAIDRLVLRHKGEHVVSDLLQRLRLGGPLGRFM